MVISSGNYFRKEYTLTEDTTITGGNFVLCKITTNGFNLDIQGGNIRGLYIDGVKQDTYTWQRHEPLELATTILHKLRKVGGDDAVSAWLWAIEWLIANPAATYTEWQSAYTTWANSTGNLAYSAALFVRLRDLYFPGMSFTQVRDAINGYTLDTWKGKATELVEEYS